MDGTDAVGGGADESARQAAKGTNSASAQAAHSGNAGLLLKKHVMWLAISLVGAWAAYRVDYHWWLARSRWIFVAAVVCLVLVLIPRIERVARPAAA